MTPEEPFWMSHEWWARRGDAEISLHDLVARFAALTDRGGSHPALFARELQCWIRLICQTDWVRADIGPGAAMLATHGVRSPFRNSAAWDAISVLLGLYGAPLTALSLSFYDDAHDRRPAVDAEHASPIRERARSVAKAVRGALVGPSRVGGSVLASGAALQEFLAGVPAHRDDIRTAAMQSYAEGLLGYAAAAQDPGLDDAVDGSVDEIAAEFGFASAPLKAAAKRPRADFGDQAASLVFAASLRNPRIQDKDFYLTAVERAIKKVDNRLRAGGAIPDADFILARTATDLETEGWRPKSTTEVAASPQDIAEAVEDPRHAAGGFRAAQEHVEQRDLLEGAVDYLREVRIVARLGSDLAPRDVDAFWEKATALAIVRNQTELITLERPTVRHVVIERWLACGGRPADAVCSTRVQAAKFVQGLLQLAVSHALPDVTVFPDWIGRDEVSSETWSRRIAAVDAVLAENRRRTSQDVFNEVHQKGERK